MPIRVVVVGVGGIGCCLVPDLCRFLVHGDRYSPIELALIDGDDYKPGDAARQAFRMTRNKAQETAERLAAEFPRISFRAVPCFLARDNVASQLRTGDVIFCCVDNHATRKLVSDRCGELDDVLLISGGNESYYGISQVYARRGGGTTPDRSPIRNTTRRSPPPPTRTPASRPIGEALTGTWGCASPDCFFRTASSPR